MSAKRHRNPDTEIVLKNTWLRPTPTTLYRPETEAEFKEFFRSMGKAGESYSHFVERHNKASNKMMARTNGVIPTIGHKPLTGQESQEDVQFFPIPNSHLYIRIWSGGMDRYGQYCLDYFDPATNTPVKAPEGHQIWPIPRPGVFSFAGALQSWEASFECAEYSEENERYSVPEGSWWRLVRPGQPYFSFAIPVRGQAGLATPIRLP